MFLVFDGLAEDGVAAAVLFLHGPRGFFDVIEHLGLNRGGVGNHSLGLGINLQYRTATWAGYFERWRRPRHIQNDTAKTGFSEAPA